MDSCLRLVDSFPRLLVVPHVLEDLRAVRAARRLRGRPSASELLGAIAPALGVNALTQAAIDHALKIGDPEIERRRRSSAASGGACWTRCTTCRPTHRNRRPTSSGSAPPG